MQLEADYGAEHAVEIVRRSIIDAPGLRELGFVREGEFGEKITQALLSSKR